MSPFSFSHPTSHPSARLWLHPRMRPRPGPFSQPFSESHQPLSPGQHRWPPGPPPRACSRPERPSQSGDHQITSLKTLLGLNTFYHTSSLEPDKLTSPQGLCTHSSHLSDHRVTSAGCHLTQYFLGEVFLGHPSLALLYPTALTHFLA